MVKYNGINHLALVTHNMDETIRFWRDLLGMRLVLGLGKPGYRHYFFEISETDLIAFFEWPGVEKVEEKDHGYPVKGPVAFDHVSIGVTHRDDLWVIKDKLDAAGFWTSEVIDHGFILSLYSFDPNGVAIEFSWLNPEVDIRKTPMMLDSQPSEVAMEGPDPKPDKVPPVLSPTPASDRIVYPGEGRQLRDRTNRWRHS
ncbi:VOC family protein [Thermodesulforhabdus norvegica]|uniref:Catechol 2,3-dioxygenase n=1 Tax=Thermodesulforhabdus norvegica TaxID=39841 RepID=A0A1I4VRK3_9BACT|nr:VOC family protein [Thermodesulforhabdus norvegica]SFN03872.1 Catechol 2,3-dioxygenase [Thermodesulforhabdus norvegica]